MDDQLKKDKINGQISELYGKLVKIDSQLNDEEDKNAKPVNSPDKDESVIKGTIQAFEWSNK